MKNLILLHGALGSKVELIALGKSLSQKYDVHILEFDGHGRTQMKYGFSIPDFAKNLHTFVVQNNLQGADVFGYSMGGYVALYMASEHPELLGNIITLGTKFHWTPEASAKEVGMLNPEIIEEKVPKFANYLAQLHGAEDWKQNMRYTAQLMYDLGNNELLENRFASIRNPCFIGLGELDSMVSLEETRHAVRCIPNASYYNLPNTLHPIGKVDVEVLSGTIKTLLG